MKIKIEFFTDSSKEVLDNLILDLDNLIRERINTNAKVSINGRQI